MRPAFRAPRGEPRIRQLFDNWLAWCSDPALPGGCIFMAAATELDDKQGRPRDYLVATQKQLLATLAKSARLAVEAGHFRPDLDGEQFAFELHSLLMGCSHWKRLLGDPRAERRTRAAFDRLLAWGRAPSDPADPRTDPPGRSRQPATDPPKTIRQPHHRTAKPPPPSTAPLQARTPTMTPRKTMTDRPSLPAKIERTFVSIFSARPCACCPGWRPPRPRAWALRLWSTPRRPAPPRPPQVPELPARPLAVALGGAPLAAWSWGQGPTVLLVHGWSGYAGQMTAFVAPLVAAGFRVVAFDHPAHGQSPGRTSNSLRMRDAVLAVARAAGPVHALIAHSLGAAAAVMALVQGLRVDRVVLVAPPAEAPSFARAFAAAIGLSPARTEGMLARAQRRLGIDFSALDLRLHRAAACACPCWWSTTPAIARSPSATVRPSPPPGPAPACTRPRASATTAPCAPPP